MSNMMMRPKFFTEKSLELKMLSLFKELLSMRLNELLKTRLMIISLFARKEEKNRIGHSQENSIYGFHPICMQNFLLKPNFREKASIIISQRCCKDLWLS